MAECIPNTYKVPGSTANSENSKIITIIISSSIFMGKMGWQPLKGIFQLFDPNKSKKEHSEVENSFPNLKFKKIVMITV